MSTTGFSFPADASMDEVEELVGQGLDAMCEAFYAGNEGVSVDFSKESIVLQGLKDTKKTTTVTTTRKTRMKMKMSGGATTTQQERFSTKKRCAWDASKIPVFFSSRRTPRRIRRGGIQHDSGWGGCPVEQCVTEEAVQTANTYSERRAIGGRSPSTIAKELLCLSNQIYAALALGNLHGIPRGVKK
jgi:hypothetical protein